jgi:hypothetical protein
MKILNTKLYSSFLDGMSVVLDVGATRSFRSPIRRKYFLSAKRWHHSDLSFLDQGNLVDSSAISSDWNAVGDDIKSAISQYARTEG